MQNAKDTFYEVLRTRLAALNPERTVVVRGITRPALLVIENEIEFSTAPPDCFLMRWTAMGIDDAGALPQIAMRCEIGYETAGNGFNAGLDRGRLLAAMDGELNAMLTQTPPRAVKQNYTALAGNPPGDAQPMLTSIWWSAPAFGAATIKNNRIGRIANIEVMSLQEGDEL